MPGQIHVGDIGTSFEVTLLDENNVAVDVSSAITKELIFMSPLTKRMDKTAAFVSTGVDGKIKYVTVASDLDEPGPWKLQAKIVLVTGTWYSNIHSFTVYENLWAGL